MQTPSDACHILRVGFLAPETRVAAARMKRFEFAFDPLYRAVGAPLGVSPKRCWVEVDETQLQVRFGLWALRTAVANVAGTEVTGPYRKVKTVGPAHLSLKDKGVTFATNARRGLCIRFHQPIAALEPLGYLRHPAVTVTVADVEGLAAALPPTATGV